MKRAIRVVSEMFKTILLRKKNVFFDFYSALHRGGVGDIRGSRRFPVVIRHSNLRGVSAGEGCKFDHCICHGNIKIDRFVSINGPGTVVRSAINNILIGSFCSIAHNVTIQEYNHMYDRVSTYLMHKNIFDGDYKNDVCTKGDIIIEEDTWIGASAVILSGVRISRGSIVAAGSIVTKNVEPYTIVAGNPAKPVKKRFSDETIIEIEQSRWWEWPVAELLRNRSYLTSKLTK